ncbi:HtaA domain-containing protein [Streptomyces pseudogriseolus]|uniref:HtaA domain-containing protein n=1 Tax=Streptomyces pseudogriseolus TaxID=36817 RepID=UPI003FA1D90A
MSARRRRSLALAAAVATAAALGATAAPSATAAEIPLSGYELTWGIKQSYRTYVTTFAQGAFTPTGGARQAENYGAFTFTGGTGTYDSTTHATALGFQGELNITSTAHGFELTLSDLKFDSGAGRITADVERGGTTQDDVPLATVTVTRSMTDMATTLTEEAGEVFGSASYPGAAGDPLTVVKTADPEPEPSPTETATTPPASPTAEPTGSATPTAAPTTSASPTTQSPTPTPSATASQSTAPATRGEIADGTLDWGVKQSFRAYVTGPVAKGEITASDGATQAAGNGAFTFSDATGAYDTEAGTLKAAFKGAVTFKGHEHDGAWSLDLTFSDLRVNLTRGKGTLSADVDDLGETSQDVVLADLSAPSAELTARDDVITLDGVTATLTEAGAEAFGGFYTAGAALDPVSLAVTLTEDAELPAGTGGTDGGNGGSGTGTGGTGTDGGSGATGSTTGGTGSTVGGDLGGSLASTGSDVPVGALGAAAGAAVAAGAGAVLFLRRRNAMVE